MCLMVLNWRPDHDWPLLLVANRDEFRERPTRAMHWWSPEDGGILAGRDLKAGGTWLAVDADGRFALLTNIRPGYVGLSGTRSRGELPVQFLTGQKTIEAFHDSLLDDLADYGGFNLVLGDRERLFWFSSDHPRGHWLEPGIHTLSNDALNTPWPKTRQAHRQMAEAGHQLEQGHLHEASILTDKATAPDSQLPQTGVPQTWEKQLSAQTITGDHYGTRCRTALRMHREGQLDVAEVQLGPSGEAISDRQFTWSTDNT